MKKTFGLLDIKFKAQTIGLWDIRYLPKLQYQLSSSGNEGKSPKSRLVIWQPRQLLSGEIWELLVDGSDLYYGHVQKQKTSRLEQYK
jgi:hypothetical protein